MGGGKGKAPQYSLEKAGEQKISGKDNHPVALLQTTEGVLNLWRGLQGHSQVWRM